MAAVKCTKFKFSKQNCIREWEKPLAAPFTVSRKCLANINNPWCWFGRKTEIPTCKVSRRGKFAIEFALGKMVNRGKLTKKMASRKYDARRIYHHL